MKKLILCACFATSFGASAVDVIVNPANGSALDENEIRQIFIGKSKSFSDGTKALPITQMEGSAVTEEFNQKVLNKSASQLKAYWSKLVFTGKGTPPKEANNDAEVIKLVASNPNLIGFVTSGAADGSVKVVKSF
ncbi:phosphate ABC transporter substrate-binding protein [Pseudoalteromonas sp. T1lg65]|uniref:phosphate ABC transporter substrate-binding protein n=1 Tax=Pseudoalteromonas sp. T1lg65 TaxID=2077101 RepID=UPI003F791FB4